MPRLVVGTSGSVCTRCAVGVGKRSTHTDVNMSMRVFYHRGQVHQQDERSVNSKPYIDAGITVVRINRDGSKSFVAASGIQVDRQVQLELTLEVGEYYVIPSTTGCKLDLLRVERQAAAPAGATAAIGSMHGTKTGVMPPIAARGTVPLVDSKGQFTRQCDSALREVFRRFDEDMDGFLGRQEMNQFQQLHEGMDVDEGVYAWMLRTFDSRSDGISPDGFVDLYRWILQACGDEVCTGVVRLATASPHWLP